MFRRNASFRFAGSFPRSLSDSEAVRQLPDQIARFPASPLDALGSRYFEISLRFNSSSGVAEDFDRLVQLLDLKRLFQNGNWTDLQNSVQHLALGVTGDHDHI